MVIAEPVFGSREPGNIPEPRNAAAPRTHATGDFPSGISPVIMTYLK